MRDKALSAVLLVLSLACAQAVYAADPASAKPAQGAPQPDFSPPPVPEFMLRKPAHPLSLEEMQRQAEEAASRARAERDRRAAENEPPKNTESKAK